MADAECHQDPEAPECQGFSDPRQEKTPRSSTERSSSNITPLRSFCWGVLHAIGMFAAGHLTNEERLNCVEERAWFSIGETITAGMLAATIAVPAGFWFAERTDPGLAFIGAAVLYLLLFVFMPKLIRQAMNVDTDAVISAFGKNEQLKKVFWTFFITLAGLILAQIADPVLVQNIIGTLAGLAP
jgi:hypothetical protein